MTPRDKLKAKLAERRVVARPLSRVSLPCVHEGQLLERCRTCSATSEGRHVRECDIHGTCTRSYVSSRVWSCDHCKQYEPDVPAEPTQTEKPKVTRGHVAPLDGGWQGRSAVKPNHFDVTVVIPHLNTPRLLDLVVQMWRYQTIRPYFLVIDTGSDWQTCTELETKLRASDCEVHYIRAHAYRHSSQPVTSALDLAHTLCRTEYLFHTHSDVFPIRRDFLAFLREQTSTASPVVGWRMSPRTSPRGSVTRNEWSRCVSHTATMIHMPTAHRARLTWAMEAYFARRPHERSDTVGWPDTESPFFLAMSEAGIEPVLLGEEPNFERHTIEAGGIAWAEHARSYTGAKLQGGLIEKKVSAYMLDAENEARERLKKWEGS